MSERKYEHAKSHWVLAIMCPKCRDEREAAAQEAILLLAYCHNALSEMRMIPNLRLRRDCLQRCRDAGWKVEG